MDEEVEAVEAVPAAASKEIVDEPAKSPVPVKVFHRPWVAYLDENKSAWKELSIKGYLLYKALCIDELLEPMYYSSLFLFLW